MYIDSDMKHDLPKPKKEDKEKPPYKPSNKQIFIDKNKKPTKKPTRMRTK